MTSTENEEPKGSGPSSSECDHSTCGWKPRYYGPDGRCLHPNRRDAGTLYDGPGGRKTWLYYYCPDCKEQFRELEPPEDAPCEHGGGDMQDCRYGCAESAEPDCHRRMAVAIEGECPCPPSCDCCKAEPALPCVCGEPEAEGVEHRTDGPCYVKLPPSEGPEYTPCVCGHIEAEHEAGLKPPYSGCNQCSDCSAYRTQPEPALPQPERRPPYAVAYAVQGHLYEVALPGDATVEAVDGALVIRHSLGQVAGIVAVNPMSTKERES